MEMWAKKEVFIAAIEKNNKRILSNTRKNHHPAKIAQQASLISACSTGEFLNFHVFYAPKHNVPSDFDLRIKYSAVALLMNDHLGDPVLSKAKSKY
jgi:hypothetical protein